MSKEVALALLEGSREQDKVLGVDIAGLDLTQCDISETSTEMLKGERVILSGGILDLAYFLDADFTAANLEGASCNQTAFFDCILYQVISPNADFSYANLSASSCNESNFSSCEFDYANLWASTFVGCDLSDATLTYVEAADGCFDDANLTNADLSNGDFTGTVFRKANLTGADLSHGNFTDCDFTGATLTDVCWDNTILKNAKFDIGTQPNK